MNLDILITGFGPFPHVRVNPTTMLARAVANRLRRSGLKAEALILETSYSGGLPTLARRLELDKPRAVLMLGLAARARWIRVERFGRGRASILHPDVSGRTPTDAAQRHSGRRRSSGANLEGALAALRQNGLRTRLSPSAGRYLCDASYALALNATSAPVLFVHVPWLRAAPGQRRNVPAFSPAAATLVTALAEVGQLLARSGR